MNRSRERGGALVMTIDLIVHTSRWVSDTRYRHAMLRIPEPPHAWRIVCRHPEGGVQVLAHMAFHGGIVRTERLPLRKVRR